MTTKAAIDRFFSASKFAVVGASANPQKYGNKALNYLLALHKDVVPVNPNASAIQGIACMAALSKLPDPKNTSISIVVPPKVTLEILKEAKALNIFGLWLQPGAEDDAVVKFIQGDTQLAERCIYTKQSAKQLVSRAIASSITPKTPSPCLWVDGPPLNPSPTVPAVHAAVVEVPAVKMSTPAAEASPTLQQKEALFFSALHFAVVGASTNENKNGTKALKWLIKESKDVVPVNLDAQEIQGIKCMKLLSDLPDPTHTSVSIVVPPKATLTVLQLAKSLGIYSVWIQPGAEDDAVVEFIEADAQFKARCIYREHALHTAASPKITFHTDTTGPCIFLQTNPVSVSPAAPVATAAPAATAVSAATTAPAAAAVAPASNVVAGVKHVLSPPSTPPAAKSLKLSPDTDSLHTADLGEEIPGLA